MSRALARLGGLPLLTATLAAGGAFAAVDAEPHAHADRVRTLAVIPGGVHNFAQGGSHLAWSGPAGRPSCAGSGAGVWTQELRSGRRTRLTRCGQWGLLLTGGRAYWTSQGFSNTQESLELLTASPADRRVRRLAFQSVPSKDDGGTVDLVWPVGDGRSVFFWTSPMDSEPGPVVRFDGTRRTPVTLTIEHVWDLAAAGGRLAVAEAVQTYECAQEPAWSPDGRRIAFASGGGSLFYRDERRCRGGLWVMDADGANRRRIAAEGRDPAWSPDGSRLAFEDGSGGLVTAAASGGDVRRLAAAGADPAWSPDGTRIAFSRGTFVLVVAADGGGERVVAPIGVEPSWSPDGARLVFARPPSPAPGLGIVDADGRNLRTLTTRRDREPAWSPDGRLIAFTRGHPNSPTEDFPDEIELVAPDGSGRRTVTGTGLEGAAFAPAWSPDSRRLAYGVAYEREDRGDSHLVVRTLDEPRARQLTRTLPPETPIAVHARGGRVIARVTPDGLVQGVAVTQSTTAAIVRAGATRRLEIYAPRRRSVSLPPGRPAALVGGSGTTLVLRLGRDIHAVEARTGRRRLLARAEAPPIGLSISGRRVAWAENRGGRAYVRAVEVAP